MTDPKWQQRKWQLHDETRSHYIEYLYSTIRFAKKMLLFWERWATHNPRFSAEVVSLIGFEKEGLKSTQNELRKVLGR